MISGSAMNIQIYPLSEQGDLDLKRADRNFDCHSLGHKAPGLLQNLLPQHRLPRRWGDRVNCFDDKGCQAFRRAVHPMGRNRIGPPESCILARWFAQQIWIANHIGNVVGDLIGLAQTLPQCLPQ